jgi:hypothetical protein
MARRRSKYPDKPYQVSEDARRRIVALMEPDQREKANLVDKWVPKGGWQLWRWDDLTDVNFD